MKQMFEVQGCTLRILLPQEVDHPVSDYIRRESEKIMSREYIRNIEFDFENTEFMDSSGIGLVMGRYRALGMRSASIRAVHVSSYMNKILHLSGLHRFIEIQCQTEVQKETEGRTL
jgi:stage II sporulation protein AA (anti-sigma F factor antagonist)